MNNTPSYNPNNNEILTTETAKILDTKPLNSTPEAEQNDQDKADEPVKAQNTASSPASSNPGSEKAGKPTPRLRLTAAILSAAALLLLCGSLLARAGVPLALAESQTGDDRLAGIFVTEKYIEPGMPEIDVNAMGEIVIKEQEPAKIYGTFNEDDLSKPVTFPELEGYGIYNLQLQSGTSQEPSGYYTGDDIFTDMHVTVSDDEEHLEASFYVRAGSPWSYYLNPVYQQADGTLYLLPGEGITSDSLTGGCSWSYHIDQSKSENSNGTEETEGYRFTVKLVAADIPGETELIFVGQNNQILRSLSGDDLELLFQEDMPRLEIPADVSYLILRQTKDGTEGFTHTLFDRGAESLEYMVAADDPYLHPRHLPLIWE
ncbi:MAG TPA: hypothetical protein DCZ91_21055 [Lachnospiraceae bacterium]|nr:hypothetical protein [Lachnospiraceae bacterium]